MVHILTEMLTFDHIESETREKKQGRTVRYFEFSVSSHSHNQVVLKYYLDLKIRVKTN